jgi:putative transposase
MSPKLRPYAAPMARHPRIELPGGMYHVGARGNRGCRIYADDYERRIFLTLLERIVARYRWTCLAYCLMSNHYHLVISIEDGGLSDGMRELNGEFACFTNVRHGLEGHLFRNRFWSELIEREAHMLEGSRYVVLNPVRAGLCERPARWRWSSYRACAGLDFPPAFLAAGELLRLFGSTPRRARRGYAAFVRQELEAATGVRHRHEARTRVASGHSHDADTRGGR